MNKKEKMLNVINWLVGVVVCSLGVCFSTRAGFGLSMIAAPAYILHRFMIQFFSWFTQGTSEYIFQAILLIILCLVTFRFKAKYPLSFLTAVLAGLAIDGWFVVIGGNIVYESMVARIIAFVLGALLTAFAIAFIFRTTMPVQIYELFVMELSDRFKLDRNRVKFCFDMSMLALSLLMSLLLTHGLTGIGVGTIIVTFVNAPLIKFFGKFVDMLEGRKAEK